MITLIKTIKIASTTFRLKLHGKENPVDKGYNSHPDWQTQ